MSRLRSNNDTAREKRGSKTIVSRMHSVLKSIAVGCRSQNLYHHTLVLKFTTGARPLIRRIQKKKKKREKRRS